MVDRNIIAKLGLSNEQIEQEINELFTSEHKELLDQELQKTVESLVPGTIVKGRIVTQLGNDVIVELGLKSEGIVEASEFDDPSEIVSGKEIEVLLEEMDAENGILLSKRKADRIRGWETVITNNAEGDVVKGIVSRRIKGGLLVDIGVPVFLPASQVDIRKPGDISRFIGREIECKILKIDTENHNIVVSRRKLIEEDRQASKEKILSEIEVGQIRKGIVKNIADFRRICRPRRLRRPAAYFRPELGPHFASVGTGRTGSGNRMHGYRRRQGHREDLAGSEAERTPARGTKSKRSTDRENRQGYVVNIMNYGAFVRLEEGIEGLIHISEMSWTKRIAHPARHPDAQRRSRSHGAGCQQGQAGNLAGSQAA